MSKHIEFIRCPADRVADLQIFLKEHWSEKHIFAKDREFLEWQHLNSSDDHLNYYLALTPEGEIEAMLGYIPLDHFDPELREHKSLWITTWKVSPESKTIGLGFLILNQLMKKEACTWIGSLGLNPETLIFYKKLKFKTNQMHHHFLLNPQIEDFKLYSGPRLQTQEPSSPPQEITNFGDSTLELQSPPGTSPIKSPRYLQNRYLEHPIFSYRAYACGGGVIIIRKDTHEGHSALRLVDFLGDFNGLASAAPLLTRLLIDENAEYLDMYHFTNTDLGLTDKGWHDRHALEKEDVIVPNYYAPFTQKNIELHLAYKGEAENHVFFKGDSDQDRPN